MSSVTKAGSPLARSEGDRPHRLGHLGPARNGWIGREAEHRRDALPRARMCPLVGAENLQYLGGFEEPVVRPHPALGGDADLRAGAA